MAEPARRPAKALADGYALCTPAGQLLPHTYRETEAGAIATLFSANALARQAWALAEADGWSVEYVYARFFSPVFFVDVVPEPRPEASADAQFGSPPAAILASDIDVECAQRERNQQTSKANPVSNSHHVVSKNDSFRSTVNDEWLSSPIGEAMMDALSSARLATLRQQAGCPACAARVKIHGASDGRFSVLFACGAIFDVAEGKPISVLHPCPAPSNVAVAALNREAGEAV